MLTEENLLKQVNGIVRREVNEQVLKAEYVLNNLRSSLERASQQATAASKAHRHPERQLR